MSNKAKETLVPMDQILWLESLESEKVLHVYAGTSNKVSLLCLTPVCIKYKVSCL